VLCHPLSHWAEHESTAPERITETLDAGQTYVRHVQAFDTFGFNQGYTLQVTAP